MPLSRVTVRSLGFSVTVAALALAFAWAVLPARADDDDGDKDAKPELLKDVKVGALTQPAAPATGPSTQPTTKPVIEVDPAHPAIVVSVRGVGYTWGPDGSGR